MMIRPSAFQRSVRPRRRPMGVVFVSLLLALMTLVPATSARANARPTQDLPSWTVLASAGGATFRSLAAVSRTVAWIGSDDGTVLRTVDGGRSWRDVSPPGIGGLHVRDLYSTDARRAIAMTSGPGGESRIYTTSDAGRSWRLDYQATDEAVFFDGMAFYDPRHGIVISDPIDGKFTVLATTDGGSTWKVLPTTGMPMARPDEYGFAATGTMVTTAGRDVWFGSGGSVARIFHSHDGGYTWDVRATPILSGGSTGTAGIFGLAFRSPTLGLALGGDFLIPDARVGAAAVSHGGAWSSPAQEPSGGRGAAAWVPFTRATAVSVGFNGSDVSFDAGQHWTRFDSAHLNTVGCAADGACWATGDDGRVAALQINRRQPVQQPPQLLAVGLDGAIGSTIGPDGALYVTEGGAGRVSRIDLVSGRKTTVASGLPKRVGDIGGAMDVAFLGRTLYVLVTLVSPDVGGQSVDGIYRVDGPHTFTVIADIGAFSLVHPPKTAFFVPTGVQYAMQPYHGGFLVSDGHHNRVLRVTVDGAISQLLTFPDVVPTGLALHNGKIYVGQAGPVPHRPANGKIVAFTPGGQGADLVARGARLLVDVEFGLHNTLYALSQGYFTPGHPDGSPAEPGTGALYRLDEDGILRPVATGLDRPTSLEIVGRYAYVVNLAGQVWRLSLGGGDER